VRPTSKKSFIQRVSNHLKWRWLNVQSDARIANSLLSMFWIWTAFSDQLLILTKEYGLTRSFGPTSLIGSKEFLNLNGYTWEKLNADRKGLGDTTPGPAAGPGVGDSARLVFLQH
jgi:hypothetical protein